METFKLNDTQSLYGYSNLSELNYYTVEIGGGIPKTKSHLKVGNMVIHNTRRFNWFERKMWKLFFGFEIENVKEN